MNRIILTIAAAVIGATTFFGSEAQACISCSYTPEVAKSPARTFHAQQGGGASAAQKKAMYAQAQKARMAKAQQAKMAQAKAAAQAKARAEAQAKMAQAKAAKAAIAKADTAKDETADDEVAQDEPVKTNVAKADTDTDASVRRPRVTGSSALMQASIPDEEESTSNEVAEANCKRFFPAVGMTLSVPCE